MTTVLRKLSINSKDMCFSNLVERPKKSEKRRIDGSKNLNISDPNESSEAKIIILASKS